MYIYGSYVYFWPTYALISSSQIFMATRIKEQRYAERKENKGERQIPAKRDN